VAVGLDVGDGDGATGVGVCDDDAVGVAACVGVGVGAGVGNGVCVGVCDGAGVCTRVEVTLGVGVGVDGTGTGAGVCVGAWRTSSTHWHTPDSPHDEPDPPLHSPAFQPTPEHMYDPCARPSCIWIVMLSIPASSENCTVEVSLHLLSPLSFTPP